MDNRILVAYATWTGSTQGVAEAIGKVLSEGGAAVDVRPVKEVKDLSGYRAVVLGAPVQAFRVHGDALKFVRRHAQALARVPVAYFVVCVTMKEDTEANRAAAGKYIEALRKQAPQVTPVATTAFAGAIIVEGPQVERLGFLRKMMVRSMKASAGDFRNWDAIRAWAIGIKPALLG
jgi:menaquinone-dependent protoporphyrinogen oxidase